MGIADARGDLKFSPELKTYLDSASRAGKRITMSNVALARVIQGGKTGAVPSRTRDNEGRRVITPEVATQALIEKNLLLVAKVARHYVNIPGVDVNDIIGDGNLGLITAAKKFDPTRGVTFSTHATHWIREAIGRGIPGHRLGNYLGYSRVEDASQAETIRRTIHDYTGEVPTNAEVAVCMGTGARSGVTTSRVDSLQAAMAQQQNPTYLDEVIVSPEHSTEGGKTRGDFIPQTILAEPERALLDAERYRKIVSVLDGAGLDEQQRVHAGMTVFYGAENMDVAQTLKVTPHRSGFIGRGASAQLQAFGASHPGTVSALQQHTGGV